MANTGLIRVLARRNKLRLTLFVALFSLLSLQLTASDHWHGVADTQHCEVCMQGGQAPLAHAVELPLPVICVPTAAVTGCSDAPASPQALPRIRAPPGLS